MLAYDVAAVIAIDAGLPRDAVAPFVQRVGPLLVDGIERQLAAGTGRVAFTYQVERAGRPAGVALQPVDARRPSTIARGEHRTAMDPWSGP